MKLDLNTKMVVVVVEVVEVVGKINNSLCSVRPILKPPTLKELPQTSQMLQPSLTNINAF